MYGEGISRLGEIDNLGVEQKVIEKAAMVLVQGERLGQGRERQDHARQSRIVEAC
jgi:recombination protein RecA